MSTEPKVGSVHEVYAMNKRLIRPTTDPVFKIDRADRRRLDLQWTEASRFSYGP